MVDTGAEVCDQSQIVASLCQNALVDTVGQGRHQDVGGLHCGNQLIAGHRMIVIVEPGVE
jgi:hypothetical protein